MQLGNQMKNLHLLLSVLIVVPIAFVYGFSPNFISQQLFTVEVSSLDMATIFKAIMGLYLASGGLWVLGILNPKYWEAATISNIVFMFGLSFGRIIGFLFDGIPSPIFCVGTLGELVLAIYGCYQLTKLKKSS
jgi:hypothetical protein